MGLSVERKRKLKKILEIAAKGPWESSLTLMGEALANPPTRLVDLTDLQIALCIAYGESAISIFRENERCYGKCISIWND